MPKPEVSVIIRAKDLASRTLGQFRRRLAGITRVARQVTRNIAAITAAAAGLVFGLQRLGKRGAEVEGVQRAFTKITEGSTRALLELREAAAGTISDFQLMTSHNQALALGAAKTSEEFAEMVRQARLLGRAQGIEASEALDKYTVGLARQSKLRLDDLGLNIQQTEANERYAKSLGKTIAQLTEAERKEAFRVETFRQGAELVDRIAGEELKGAAAADRFAAALANARDRVAEFVAQSPAVAAFFDELTGLVSDIADLFAGEAPLLEEGMKELGRLAGDAFSVGMNEAVAAFIDKGNFFGRAVAGHFERQAAEALDRLRARRQQLAATAEGSRILAERRIQERERDRALRAGGDTGGGTTPPGFTPFGDFTGTQEQLVALRDRIKDIRGDLAGARLDAPLETTEEAATKAREKVEALETALRRLLELAARFGGEEGLLLRTATVSPVDLGLLRERFGPARPGALTAGGVPQLLPFGEDPRLSDAGGRGLLIHQREQQRRLEEASKSFDDASQVAVAGFLAMGQAAIEGTELTAQSVINMISNILQSIPGVGGLAGALIGGIGGLVGAAFGRRDRDPVRVAVADYESAAERKMRDIRSGPERVTVVIEQDGVPIEVIERELLDRQARDAVVRFPPSGGDSWAGR